VKKCFCSNCSTYNDLQDCEHIETLEAGSEDNDDLTLPIDIEEEYGNFFFVVYAHSKLNEEGIYYISRTQTLTSMFISMSYIYHYNLKDDMKVLKPHWEIVSQLTPTLQKFFQLEVHKYYA
jgi:hypothetical protein